jgi:dTDP-4-dehydrorhamnose 3,5-epimerase
VKIEALGISGAWECYPVGHADERGLFLELYSREALRAHTGLDWEVHQISLSVSRKGVVRGMHGVRRPPGQGKFVTCASGEVLDVVVDLRPESPHFLSFAAVTLSGTNRRGIIAEEGLGHGFQVLSGEAVMLYATTQRYDPECEYVVDAFDPALGLPWQPMRPIMSQRDANALTVSSLLDQADCPLILRA